MSVAKYSLVNFLVPLSPNDKSIKLRDINNIIMYDIYPVNVLSTFVVENKLNIKTRSSEIIIVLYFSTKPEAIAALNKLQEAIDLLKSFLAVVPPEIINYVDNRLLEYSMGNRFIHHQTNGSDTWMINHKLGYITTPIIFNDLYEEIEGYIRHIDVNNTLVKFNKVLTGYVVF